MTKPLRAYMAFNRVVGSQEAAVLVLAHTAREARVLAFREAAFEVGVSWWSGEDGWIDLAVRWIKDVSVLDESEQELMKQGKPCVIIDPVSCWNCYQWGMERESDGACVICGAPRAEGMPWPEQRRSVVAV